MRIEILAGSPREHSTSRRVALHLQQWLSANTDHEVGVIDLYEWNLPPLESVFLNAEKTPEAFRPLSQRIFAADAFILVTPEYNGSYSAALKNLLDHFPKQHHKPFGIVTASTGALGGIRATQQMLLLIPALFGIASPYMLAVPHVDRKFSETGELIDEAFTHNVHNFVKEFLWLAERLVKEPATL